MPLNERVVIAPPVGFLEEKSGVKSSMRLMSMIALIASIGFGIATIRVLPSDSESKQEGMYITFGFLLAAFAPKALQKFAENMPTTSANPREIITEQISFEASESERLRRENVALQRQLDDLSRRIDANSSFSSAPIQTEEFAEVVPDRDRPS